MAFATSGENMPVPARGLGERVVVVARLALLPARQMRLGQLARQPSIALRPARQDQQVWPRRVGHLGAGDVSQRELGAEHRLHVEFPEPPRRIGPPRTTHRDRSARWPAGSAGRPPRRVPPECSPHRGSCRPSGRVVRHTASRSGCARDGPAARSSRACGTRPDCHRHRRLAREDANRRGAACR